MSDSTHDKNPQNTGVAVGNVDGKDPASADTARVVDPIAERRLCRKFDIRLLPVLAVMCELHYISNLKFVLMIYDLPDSDLFNALDKGNLGNAQTAGLTDGKQYSVTSKITI